MKRSLPTLIIFYFLFGSATVAQNTNFTTEGFFTSRDPEIIHYVARQPDGKILISGSFHRFMGRSVKNLIRLNPDGQLDTTFSSSNGTNNSIVCMAASADGSFFLAGGFQWYRQSAVPSGFIRILPNGELDQKFQSDLPSWLTHAITAITPLPDGKVLVAGQGLTPGLNADSTTVVRLNKDGSYDAGFNTQNVANSMINGIILMPDQSIITYGWFTQWNNVSVPGIVRLNADGSVNQPFAAQTKHIVSTNSNSIWVKKAILASDGGLVLVGSFPLSYGANEKRVIKLLNNGSLDPDFELDAAINGGWVYNIEQLEDQSCIIAGGLQVNGSSKWFARIKTNGSLVAPNSFIGPDQPDGSFGSDFIVPTAGNEFFAAGTYSGVSGGKRIGIFNKFHSDLTPYLDNPLPFLKKGAIVETAIDSAHRIVVVGNFNRYGESSDREQNYIARLLPDGQLDTAFHTTGTNSNIYKVAVQKDGRIVVVGGFTELSGAPIKAIGRFKADGAPDYSFNANAQISDGYYDLHVAPDEKMYVTGSFRSFNSVPAKGIVRLNNNGAVDPLFLAANLSFLYAPYTVATAPDGSVVIGEGSDLTVRHFNQPMRIARLGESGSQDLAFTPPVMDFPVSHKILIANDGSVYWTGIIFLDNIFGKVRQPLLKLNADGTLDSVASANIPENFFVNDFTLLPSQKIVVAGRMLGVYDSLDVVMRLNPDLSVDRTFTPVGVNYNILHVNHDGDDKIIVAGEPRYGYRLETEQIQNIAVISENGMKINSSTSTLQNLIDTAVFENVKMGNSVEQVLTIKNDGETAINFSSQQQAGISGSHADEFSLTFNSPLKTLQPGDSVRFKVKLNPKSVGAKSARINIPFFNGISQLYTVNINAYATHSSVIQPEVPSDTTETPGTPTQEIKTLIFPNPLSGTLLSVKAESGFSSYEIADIKGNILQTGLIKSTDGLYNILLKHDFKGMFILRLRQQNKVVAKPFVRL